MTKLAEGSAAQMKELDEQGVPRHKIAASFGVSPSRVTRILGARRGYVRRDDSLKIAADSASAEGKMEAQDENVGTHEEDGQFPREVE